MNAAICPDCLRLYILGVNGTVDGCDTCQHIERNIAGQIIVNADDVNDDEDHLTDMERA